MKCAEIMSSPVRTVRDTEDALLVASLMREHDVGFLPVCDAAGRVVGVVTERDLAIRVCAENAEAMDVVVSHIMTSPPITCRPTQSVDDVRRRMTAHRHSVLAVVDAGDHPVGVISLWDIYESADYQVVGLRKSPGRDQPGARSAPTR